MMLRKVYLKFLKSDADAAKNSEKMLQKDDWDAAETEMDAVRF